MAPPWVFTIWATPALPLPAWVSAGHSTVEPLFSFQLGAAFTRYLVKFSVVPEPSERWATTIAVAGRVASGFRSLMAGSSQLLMSRWKIFAVVSASRVSSFTPERL